MGLPKNQGYHLYNLLFADDQVIIAQDIEDAEYILRKLVKEYMKWGLHINFWKTEYLTLGAGIVTEIGQIKAVNKFKYLGSTVEATGTTISEKEKRISEGISVIGMLNSVLWSKTTLQSYVMGPSALLTIRRKVCGECLSPLKSQRLCRV
jgi:hypothetical protein